MHAAQRSMASGEGRNAAGATSISICSRGIRELAQTLAKRQRTAGAIDETSQRTVVDGSESTVAFT
jgi:hypothetical protein